MEMRDGRLTEKALAQQDAAATAVDHYRDDYIQLLGDLVRCPTLLGAERPAQDILYRHLQVMGLEAERWDLDPEDLSSHSTFAPVDWGYQERPNVRGTLKPAGRAGRSLVLNGHVDVVSPEPVDWWSYDPWGATITDGRMYGRGSMDMKAGLAAALLAIQAVMDTGVELRGPVIFESVIEEECTGNGMLASRIRSGKVDGAVITEPTGLQAWTATPGVLWFEVTVRGKPAYVGKVGQYVNAIETATSLIARLKPAAVEALNAAFDHPSFAGYKNPLTLSVGKIQGGDWPSNVPLECRFTCRMSFPIGWSFDQARSFVETHLERASSSDPWLVEQPPTLRFPGFRALGWALDSEAGDGSLIHSLSEAHQTVRGRSLKQEVFPGTADARYFSAQKGEQAVYYGPSGANLHAPDEYVELESLVETARVLARMIIVWCG